MKKVMIFAAIACAAFAAMVKADDTSVTGKSDNSAMNDKNANIRVRYIVNDVEAAVAFYTKDLQFHLLARSVPYFAIVTRGNLQLVLSPPKGPGGASQPMPDGRRPEPGGWNRIVGGPGGREILLEDPSGNPIELFEATRQQQG